MPRSGTTGGTCLSFSHSRLFTADFLNTDPVLHDTGTSQAHSCYTKNATVTAKLETQATDLDTRTDTSRLMSVPYGRRAWLAAKQTPPLMLQQNQYGRAQAAATARHLGASNDEFGASRFAGDDTGGSTADVSTKQLDRNKHTTSKLIIFIAPLEIDNFLSRFAPPTHWRNC